MSSRIDPQEHMEEFKRAQAYMDEHGSFNGYLSELVQKITDLAWKHTLEKLWGEVK